MANAIKYCSDLNLIVMQIATDIIEITIKPRNVKEISIPFLLTNERILQMKKLVEFGFIICNKIAEKISGKNMYVVSEENIYKEIRLRVRNIHEIELGEIQESSNESLQSSQIFETSDLKIFEESKGKKFADFQEMKSLREIEIPKTKKEKKKKYQSDEILEKVKEEKKEKIISRKRFGKESFEKSKRGIPSIRTLKYKTKEEIDTFPKENSNVSISTKEKTNVIKKKT
jgi:hypothetical protein